MFLNGLTSVIKLSLKFLVLLLNFDILLLKISNLFVLNGGFIFKSLILDLNVPLDFRDILLGLFLSVEFEIG